MRVVLVVAALATSAGATETLLAQASPPADAPVQTPAPATPPATPAPPAASPPPAPAPLPPWAVGLDVGVPDGLGIGVSYRPVWLVRAGLAATYNVIGFGARGSISLIPIDAVVSPTLNLDVGYNFQSDVSSIIKASGLPYDPSKIAVAKNVSYWYGNLHLGVEVGSPRAFMFFLRAGVSYLQARVPNVSALLADPTLEAGPATIKAVAPSAKLGVIAYF